MLFYKICTKICSSHMCFSTNTTVTISTHNLYWTHFLSMLKKHFQINPVDESWCETSLCYPHSLSYIPKTSGETHINRDILMSSICSSPHTQQHAHVPIIKITMNTESNSINPWDKFHNIFKKIFRKHCMCSIMYNILMCV